MTQHIKSGIRLLEMKYLRSGDRIHIYSRNGMYRVVKAKKNEIDITVEDGNLIIKGTKADKEEETEYLYKGIGTRSFTKTLRIADTVEVKGAEFADGILKIGLENIIPDHKKPRKVEIGKQIKFAQAELLTE